MDNIQKLDLVGIELNSGNLHRTWLNHSIGTGDNRANRFGMRVFRDGQPVTLGGASVQGYFRNSQGTNIAISSGTISGNTAYVTLPQACYNYDGPFTLAIKLIGDGVTGTMRIVDGMVDNTNSGSAVAPTGTVPTYQEVLAVYDQMVAAKNGSVRFDIEQTLNANQKAQARANTESAREGNMAPEYDTMLMPIEVGTYAMHNGLLYRCTTRITDDASWTAGHWQQCTATGEIINETEDLRSALNTKANQSQVDDLNQALNNTIGGATFSKSVQTAHTTNKIDYNFIKGQTVTYTNNCSAAVAVKLYESNGTSHDVSNSLNAGKSITFVVEFDNCVQIGGYCGGTGSIALTIVDLNNVIDAKVDTVDAKADAALANLQTEKDRSLADLSWTANSYINTSGAVVSGNLYRYSSLIPVKTGSSIAYDLDNANNVAVTICAYDALENFVRSKSIYYDPNKGTGVIATFTGTYVVPDGISFVRICHQTARANQTVTVPELVNAIQEIQNDLEEIKTELDTFDLTNQWKNKKWVAFGTSITDNYSQGSYITYGDHEGEHTGKYVPYLLDMSELSESAFVNRGIAGGSINGHILYYIRYYTSDESTADLITIEGAVNDFSASVPLGSVGDTVPYTNNLLPDSTAQGTFAGACYQAFTTAITNAPNAVVVLLTETTGKGTNQANYDQIHKNSLGLYQSDYIDMTMKVAEFVGIPVINCGRDSMINAENPQYIADHIHHTYLGGYQYARTIWAKLKGIPTKALEVPN